MTSHAGVAVASFDGERLAAHSAAFASAEPTEAGTRLLFSEPVESAYAVAVTVGKIGDFVPVVTDKSADGFTVTILPVRGGAVRGVGFDVIAAIAPSVRRHGNGRKP
ncbi:MAG: hypothetical protein OXF88_02915 [Rhodobacteraceae bacterium]|nr:hypothetical protein [Paracoccaceae bacterium]